MSLVMILDKAALRLDFRRLKIKFLL